MVVSGGAGVPTECLVLMVYGSILEGVDLLCQAISNMR